MTADRIKRMMKRYWLKNGYIKYTREGYVPFDVADLLLHDCSLNRNTAEERRSIYIYFRYRHPSLYEEAKAHAIRLDSGRTD